MTTPVPPWVHMADVPPPVDEEPWYCCGNPVRHYHDLRSARRRSGTIAAACLLGAVLVLVLAWWLR